MLPFALYATECVLALPSAHLFLQYVRVGSMLQGVTLPQNGTVGAHDLDGHISSRCRQVCASGGCWYGQEVPLGVGWANAPVVADAMGSSWECGEVAPGLQWVEGRHGMVPLVVTR